MGVFVGLVFFGIVAFCLLQENVNHAARRDDVVGAEPSLYSRPDLWEEGVN